jgi:asparagine synthase (glutamine-hydrolysing)
MSAVFGVMGPVTAGELDEMGRRLAHRGAHARWREVASGVCLGQVSAAALAPADSSSLSMVIDASECLPHGSYAQVSTALLRDRSAVGLDRALRAPFTFAAWDHARQTLLLGRDFLGLKPLHFCRLPSGGIAFATEYKALLAIGEFVATPDLNAVACLQAYKAVPAGSTLLAGVSPIPPGAILHFARDGRIRRQERMPVIRLAVEPMTLERACTDLRRELVSATAPLVKDRSRIALALSGGIDSLSTAHLARRCAPDAEMVGFTAGQSADDPEVERAARAMSHLCGRHVAFVVGSDELVSRLPLAIWHLENPIGRSETFQYFCLARLAQEQGFDFLLTGMGADLLFGGMPRHKVLWMAEAMPLLRKDLLAFFEATQTCQPPTRWLARAMHSAYYRGGLPSVPSVINAGRTHEPDLLADPGPEFLNRCLMLDGQEPTSRTLARIERPLQAYGIEYGSPFLDKRVIEFAFTMPGRLKIRRGVQKYVLREAMRPLMHDELRRAPKELMCMNQNTGFAATLQQLADRYLSTERIRRRGLFELRQVDQIRRACRRGYHPETAMRLWTLIATEVWAEIYLDTRGRCPQPAHVPVTQVAGWEPIPTPAMPSAQGWIR